MSDFDKEAEREKLREKYEDEEENRAATEQMSELLLKGATMTNAHCTDCGDPIFRYDGQEFCPTCQKPVAREQAENGEADDGDDHIEVADPSDDAHVQFGGDAADAQETDGAEQSQQPSESPAQPQQSAPNRQTETPDQPTRRIPSADPDSSPAERSVTDAGRQARDSAGPASNARPETARSTADGSVAEDLSAAESLLAETVHRFARRAAETDDPRSAREHLETAREAATALDAVRF